MLSILLLTIIGDKYDMTCRLLGLEKSDDAFGSCSFSLFRTSSPLVPKPAPELGEPQTNSHVAEKNLRLT